MHSALRQLVFHFTVASMLLACDQTSPDYYPLEPGSWWQYGISLQTMDGHRLEKQVVRNVARAEQSGRVVYYRQTTSGQQSQYWKTDTGIQRTTLADITDNQQPTATVLGLPLQLGTQWTGTITSSVLEKTGPPQNTLFRIRERVQMSYRIVSVTDTVRLKGVVYRNCVRVQGSGSVNANVGNYIGRIAITVESEDWYAPGIGLVKSAHRENTDNETISGGEYQLVLEHFMPG